MLIIGIDPHPPSHTAAVLDKNGQVLNHLTVSNNEAGLKKLLKWLKSYDVEICAIEGANNPFARNLSKKLMSSYEVVNVSPSLTSQYRSKRTNEKNDEIDAENVARAYLANPSLVSYCPDDRIEQVKALSRSRESLVKQKTAHGLSFNATDNDDVKAALQAVIEVLKKEIKTLEAKMKLVLKALMPELTQIQGIALVQAATLLAEVGDVRVFKSQHAFAMAAGCAPVERSSGGQKRYQVNTRGNRRLNRVFHLIVQVRLRLDPKTKAFLEKKQQEGKTRRAALRCLKTYVAREVYKFMLHNTKANPQRWIST